jgi:ATP-dependent helicase YprA (DUF1998 family)
MVPVMLHLSCLSCLSARPPNDPPTPTFKSKPQKNTRADFKKSKVSEGGTGSNQQQRIPTPLELIEQSCETLTIARASRRAAESGFDSDTWRMKLSEMVMEKKGFNLYIWQENVAEAVEYRLDVLSLAATSSGKTLQFATPLLAHTEKKLKLWVISPLKCLQLEQVRYYLVN